MIRPADPRDTSTLQDIFNAEVAGGTASWTTVPRSLADMEAWVAARRAGGAPVLVAEAAGRGVVGYASYGPFRTGQGYARTVEHSVYVARDARRQGVARRLMAALIAEARAAGLARMVGGVSADQAASIALHEALGFEEQGRLLGVGEKAGRRLDLVLMVLALDGEAGTARGLSDRGPGR